jgi:hypothetical protein
VAKGVTPGLGRTQLGGIATDTTSGLSRQRGRRLPSLARERQGSTGMGFVSVPTAQGAWCSQVPSQPGPGMAACPSSAARGQGRVPEKEGTVASRRGLRRMGRTGGDEAGKGQEIERSGGWDGRDGGVRT